jgi:hypothetical protein
MVYMLVIYLDMRCAVEWSGVEWSEADKQLIAVRCRGQQK